MKNKLNKININFISKKNKYVVNIRMNLIKIKNYAVKGVIIFMFLNFYFFIMFIVIIIERIEYSNIFVYINFIILLVCVYKWLLNVIKELIYQANGVCRKKAKNNMLKFASKSHLIIQKRFKRDWWGTSSNLKRTIETNNSKRLSSNNQGGGGDPPKPNNNNFGNTGHKDSSIFKLMYLKEKTFKLFLNECLNLNKQISDTYLVSVLGRMIKHPFIIKWKNNSDNEGAIIVLTQNLVDQNVITVNSESNLAQEQIFVGAQFIRNFDLLDIRLLYQIHYHYQAIAINSLYYKGLEKIVKDLKKEYKDKVRSGSSQEDIRVTLKLLNINSNKLFKMEMHFKNLRFEYNEWVLNSLNNLDITEWRESVGIDEFVSDTDIRNYFLCLLNLRMVFVSTCDDINDHFLMKIVKGEKTASYFNSNDYYQFNTHQGLYIYIPCEKNKIHLSELFQITDLNYETSNFLNIERFETGLWCDIDFVKEYSTRLYENTELTYEEAEIPYFEFFYIEFLSKLDNFQ